MSKLVRQFNDLKYAELFMSRSRKDFNVSLESKGNVYIVTLTGKPAQLTKRKPRSRIYPQYFAGHLRGNDTDL